MKITKKSKATGIIRTLELPVTHEQMFVFYEGRELIQNIFPNLTPDQREFIKTGITADEWEAIFKDE